ncbi:hypothetical protein ABID99_001639 [Mucilaginibacter sp. OAE612]
MQHQCVFQLLLYCQNGRMRGGQIGRGDKAYSPVIARYEAIPNFTDGYVPLQSSRLLRRSSSQ